MFRFFIYHPDYKSLCCDVEQTELWKAQGRLIYIDLKVIEHRHPATGHVAKDALYERNDALWGEDQELYARRKQLTQPYAQWAFDSPPLWLSVCIATIPERKERLERLLEHLWWQILNTDQPRWVEILVDNGEGNIGEKRQRLLERAKGHFVAFVDDDDWVSYDYIDRVVTALRRNPTVDCASLTGVMTTFGNEPRAFSHSIKHIAWSTMNGVHLRSPNHLNPIRREIALQVGFKPLAKTEDHDFSVRVRPLLKTEASTGDEPLYHYWYNPSTKHRVMTEAEVLKAVEPWAGLKDPKKELPTLCVEFHDAKTILEIGTYKGGTSAALALALPEARITTVDLPDTAAASNNAQSSDQCGEAIRELKLEDKIEQLRMDSADLGVLYDEGRRFDAVFIDGDHSRSAVYRDLTNAAKLLTDHGVIVAHDYTAPGDAIRPKWTIEVCEAVEAFLREHPEFHLKRLPVWLVALSRGV